VTQPRIDRARRLAAKEWALAEDEERLAAEAVGDEAADRNAHIQRGAEAHRQAAAVHRRAAELHREAALAHATHAEHLEGLEKHADGA
jgi:hypothetical protein